MLGKQRRKDSGVCWPADAFYDHVDQLPHAISISDVKLRPDPGLAVWHFHHGEGGVPALQGGWS